jgi:hypothetical protein
VVKIREVYQHEVEELLPFIYPFLHSAAERSRGQCDTVEFVEGVLDGSLVPYLIYTSQGLVGCFTMAVVEYVEKRVAEIVTIAVDAPEEDWLPTVDEVINRFGKTRRCVEIEGTGRLGWTRALLKLGYRPTFATVGKKVDYA